MMLQAKVLVVFMALVVWTNGKVGISAPRSPNQNPMLKADNADCIYRLRYQLLGDYKVCQQMFGR